MKKQSAWQFLAVFVALVVTISAVRAIPGPSAFTNLNDGYVIHGTDWNGAIGGLYNYINNTLLSTTTGLNVLSSVSDMYVYDGGNLNKVDTTTTPPSDGYFLCRDTAKAHSNSGAYWSNTIASNPVNMKGEIMYGNSSNTAVALAPGTQSTVLTMDPAGSGVPMWIMPVPKGTVMDYDPTVGGENPLPNQQTIPAGWVLCDGQSHTDSLGNTITPPNLIGMFVLGGQPVGSGQTANSSGYGNKTTNTVQGGIYTGTANINGVPGTGEPFVYSGASAAVHNHTNTPASYVLVKIMKV